MRKPLKVIRLGPHRFMWLNANHRMPTTMLHAKLMLWLYPFFRPRLTIRRAWRNYKNDVRRTYRATANKLMRPVLKAIDTQYYIEQAMREAKEANKI